MANKPTRSEMENRVRAVYELLLSSTPYIDICRYVANTWGSSTRTADRYIERANNLILEEVAELRQDALEKHIAQRTNLIHSALKDGDRRLAFEVMRDLTKLQGLYPSGKIEVTTKDITNEQRVDRITTLLDSARERRTGLAN